MRTITNTRPSKQIDDADNKAILDLAVGEELIIPLGDNTEFRKNANKERVRIAKLVEMWGGKYETRTEKWNKYVLKVRRKK